MPSANPLAIFAPRLNRAGLQWMAVGSIASSAYGEFRTTNDLGLILVLDQGQAEKVVVSFPSDEFYCPPLEVVLQEAGRKKGGHFYLIHHDTAFKADIYLASHDRFQDWALQHRREIRLGDFTVWMAPPEYVIIGKLEFFREGGSEKHLRDIRGMLAVTEIVFPLLENEIANRGLIEPWRRCRGSQDSGG